MPLNLDYRPQTFDEVVGNKSIVESLKSILARKDKPHSYMFNGKRGCGKTSFARLLAKGLGCYDMATYEYDAAITNGVGFVRQVKSESLFAPLEGGIRVNIWDECHMWSKEASSGMLKFLEEPPSHIYNILCTTNPEKIIDTIKRRCTTYVVSSLTSIEMRKLLKWILESEKITITEKVQSALISASDGCPGIILVKLDQIIDIKGEEAQLEGIINATDESAQIIDICQRLIAKEGGAKKWGALAEMLKTYDQDPEQTRRAVLGYMSKVLLGCKGEDGKRVAMLMNEFANSFYDTGKAGLIASCYMACLV